VSYKYSIEAQTLCVETLRDLEQNPLFNELNEHYTHEEVADFIKWFKESYPGMATTIPGVLHRMGCKKIRLDIDQLLVTAFVSWRAGRLHED
jgi:hypothetical protein